jgi:hypothetical protein
MNKFTVSAAVMTALVALSVSAPANAEYGPNPVHRGDGKCFTYSRFDVRDASWGYWASCENARQQGCSEAGLTAFGYFGSCADKGAKAQAGARVQPASARNTARTRRPRAASR